MSSRPQQQQSNCYIPWMLSVATRRRTPARNAPAASAPAVMAWLPVHCGCVVVMRREKEGKEVEWKAASSFNMPSILSQQIVVVWTHKETQKHAQGQQEAHTECICLVARPKQSLFWSQMTFAFLIPILDLPPPPPHSSKSFHLQPASRSPSPHPTSTHTHMQQTGPKPCRAPC